MTCICRRRESAIGVGVVHFLASHLNRKLSDPAVICHFYAFSRWPRVINWSVGADSVVSFQTPSFVLEVYRTLCEKRQNNWQAIATDNAMCKQRWRISGKPSFRLAGVANERINSGHAQRQREAFQALQTVGAGCLGEYSGFVGRQSRCHFSISVSPNIYHYL